MKPSFDITDTWTLLKDTALKLRVTVMYKQTSPCMYALSSLSLLLSR